MLLSLRGAAFSRSLSENGLDRSPGSVGAASSRDKSIAAGSRSYRKPANLHSRTVRVGWVEALRNPT
jgi:hypothetical protein